jgi:hypothetical protein
MYMVIKTIICADLLFCVSIIVLFVVKHKKTNRKDESEHERHSERGAE